MTVHRRRLRIENLEDRRLLAAVNVPTDIQGEVGAVVSVPVNVDQPEGVRGALITLRYDPDVLSLTPEQVTAGTAWSATSETLVVANVDPVAGAVTVSLSNAIGSPATGGSLVVLGFRVLESAEPGVTSPIDLVDVRLNESAIPVVPAPVPGPDPTDGRVTVVSTDPTLADRITGVVFADVDNDGQPGPLEGLPGVTIRLIRQATGETFTTQTDDRGRYEFTDLPAGDYQIVQVQPAAYFDGGPNELAVSLAAGQSLIEQNFREHALRPEFFYLRLMSTPVQPVGSPAWVATLRDIQSDSVGWEPVSAAVSSELSNGDEAAAVVGSSSQASEILGAEVASATDDEVSESVSEPGTAAFVGDTDETGGGGEVDSATNLPPTEAESPPAEGEGELGWDWVTVEALPAFDETMPVGDFPSSDASQTAPQAAVQPPGTPQPAQENEDDEAVRLADIALAAYGLW